MSKTNKRKTHDQFVEELSMINSNIDILGKYVNAREKILVRCRIHNFEYYSTPDNLLHGKGCKLCATERSKTLRRKDFNDILSEFNNRGIELLSTCDEITDLKVDRLRYLCPVHGEQTILWNNFRKGAGCRKCADDSNSLNMRLETWDKIKKYFDNSEYDIISTFEEYTGSKNSCLRCLCKDHGEFNISWNNLNKFEGCPVCHSSTGERKIFHYLKENNIKFEHPFRFNGLVGLGGKKLSYDFYIPDYNLLIEYQGEQHEKPVLFFSSDINIAKQNFAKQVEHDNRKRNYANTNGYNLLEIWYYDFNNIEDILHDVL